MSQILQGPWTQESLKTLIIRRKMTWRPYQCTSSEMFNMTYSNKGTMRNITHILSELIWSWNQEYGYRLQVSNQTYDSKYNNSDWTKIWYAEKGPFYIIRSVTSDHTYAASLLHNSVILKMKTSKKVKTADICADKNFRQETHMSFSYSYMMRSWRFKTSYHSMSCTVGKSPYILLRFQHDRNIINVTSQGVKQAR